MAKNPYQVLGVQPSASDAEIRSAFRKLAKQYHPDRNPGNKLAEDRFKEVSGAFDLIGDKEKRAKFDRGEIDADGRERASSPFGGGYSGGYGHHPGAGGGPGAGASFEDLGDIFSDLFGARRSTATRGRDLRYRLDVEFLDAALGAKKRVTMPDGRNLDLAVPAGLEDGQTLRLRGQGEQGIGGGPAGDVYVEVRVKAHKIFERKGKDIHSEAPIGLKDAVLGGKISVQTIDGEVSVKAPKNASSGTVLRLKGRGIGGSSKGASSNAGDHYVKLKIMLPEGGDSALEEFVRKWNDGAKTRTKEEAAKV